MAAVTSISPAAASREAVQALFSRPPQKSPSGQTLLTTLALTFVHHGSGSDTKMLFVPWYLGDAAAKAAVDFCSVGVDGLPLSTTMGSCVAMLEGEFLRKVEGIAERVLDMAGALPSLEPFKLPAVGLLDSMDGLLPSLGELKWQPGVYKIKIEQHATAAAARSERSAAAAQGGQACVDGVAEVFEAFKYTAATKEHHCYSWMYAELMGRYACLGSEAHVAAGGQRMKLLEIGYDHGDSVLLWKSIFPASDMHSVDNGDFIPGWQSQFEALKKNVAQVGVTLHHGDQANATFLEALVAASNGNGDSPGFDIILDDGGHSMDQQQISLATLWKHIRPGGLYVIEDVETSYYTMWGPVHELIQGGPVGKPGTTIDLLKKVMDVLNKDFHRDRTYSNANYIIGVGNYTVFPGDEDIATIQCFRNMCALRKRRGGEFVEQEENGCSQKGKRPTLNTKAPCAVPGWV